MSSRLKLPGQQHHAVGAYSSNQVAYLNSEDVSSSTTDTWYPLSSYSVEFMMDDGLIMRELQEIMDVPTPVPPAKRLCCRDDASDASSTAVAYSMSI